ncbi:MAG: helix-turn-helix domain-containing protein [Thermoleophilaceae bacterium]
MASERADLVHVIDVDPDLARALDPESTRQAREQLVARVETVAPGRRRGTWGPPNPEGHLGLLVVEGLLTRQLTIGRTRCAELLGPPDLLRPWDHDGGFSLPVGARIDWEVFVATRFAVLDRAFIERASAWPELIAELAARGIWRAQSLAVHQAIGSMTRVDERVLLLFWHLAERWGRVKTEGVVLELPLTHELLARLVGAQRPSVTTAIGQLAERELVQRLPDRTWLLPHSAVAEIEPLFDAARARVA